MWLTIMFASHYSVMCRASQRGRALDPARETIDLLGDVLDCLGFSPTSSTSGVGCCTAVGVSCRYSIHVIVSEHLIAQLYRGGFSFLKIGVCSAAVLLPVMPKLHMPPA